MGAYIASCGHELENLEDGQQLLIDGTWGVYCKVCAKEYKDCGFIVGLSSITEGEHPFLTSIKKEPRWCPECQAYRRRDHAHNQEINHSVELHVATLKQWFPGAGENFISQTLDDLKLYAVKNSDYAHGGDQHGNFKRVSIILSQYPNLTLDDPVVVCLVYMLKQLDAALWLKSEKHEAKVEGVGKRLQDVGIYSSIARLLEDKK